MSWFSGNWVRKAWADVDDESVPWETFASTTDLTPAIASLPPATWAIAPRVEFVDGFVAFFQAPRRAAVYRIEEVEWFGFAHEGDGRTNFDRNGNEGYGGGDQIFAERNVPEGETDDQIHNMVTVRVELDRAVEEGLQFRVFLKAFDPDHYSSDDDFDTNGDMAHDNLHLEDATGVGGTLTANEVLVVAGDRTAETTFEITSRQPG